MPLCRIGDAGQTLQARCCAWVRNHTRSESSSPSPFATELNRACEGAPIPPDYCTWYALSGTKTSRHRNENATFANRIGFHQVEVPGTFPTADEILVHHPGKGSVQLVVEFGSLVLYNETVFQAGGGRRFCRLRHDPPQAPGHVVDSLQASPKRTLVLSEQRPATEGRDHG